MIFQKQPSKNLLTIIILSTLLTTGLLLTAQDLPSNEDLSLGSSIFVFRSSGRTAQKKFVSVAKVKRTAVQKVAAVKNIRKQYDALPVVATRRSRVKTAPLTNGQASIGRKSAREASLTLTGAAQYYYQNNDIDKSIDYYRQAIDLDTKNTDAKLGLSDALAGKGGDLVAADKNQQARALFEEAIKLNDKNSIAFSGLGEVYDALDDNAKAISNYEKALLLNADLTELNTPLGILYAQKGDLPKAESFLNKSLANNQSDATAQYFLGTVRLKQNRFEDARAALTESVRLDANLPEAHYTLGEALAKLDREADAVKEYKEATRLKPNYVDAWFGIGAAEYEQKNYDASINAYKETVRLKNDSGEAHANLADAFRQAKRYGEANGEYGLAAVFIKDDAELYSNWGFCLGIVQKWDNAVVRLNQALSLSADYIDYTNLGWAYYNSAQIDLKSKRPTEAQTKLLSAKTALQKAVELKSNFAPALINLGITLNDLGEYQAASDILKRANDQRKNWLFAINELGISYRKLNDYDNAIKQFQKAVDINDKYAVGYYNLGESQFRAGRVKDAKKSLDKLKKLDRNAAAVLEILITGAKLKN